MLQTMDADHPRDNDANTNNDSTNESCTTSPLHLRDLKCGTPDKLGNTVQEIMFMGAHYAVYCSDKGIYVHFSDCAEIEKEQRERFSKICPELCELRYLTAQMHGWQPWAPRHPEHSLYEHNMAQALMLMMESQEAPAKQIAGQALAMAVRRVTNDNTIRYVRACLIFGGLCLAIGALALWLLGQTEAAQWRPYVLGGMFGALGAIFSIVTRLEAFELKPCNESRMNYWMSATRVLIGVMSAVALLLFADTLMTDMLGKLTGADGGKHITEIGKNAVLWPAVAVLGFIGGFAERLIPNILRQTVDKLGLPAETDGTPVQAVRSKETAAEQKKPPPAAGQANPQPA
jgi:uncharacterized membrane protein YedE/YeeE